MLSSFVLAALAAAQAAAPQAATQPSTPAPVVAPVAPVVAAPRVLPAGTQVSLTPLEELSSKHIKEGEHYQFTVVNDVTDNGVVVIPRGSKASGVISMQTGRGIVGKSGKFEVTFESVTANGTTFPLMGVHRQEGKGNTVGALLGSMWITGHSAVMLPGQIVVAMIKDPTAYTSAAASPVQAPSPTPILAPSASPSATPASAPSAEGKQN